MGLFNIIFVLFIFSIWGYPEFEEHEFMFCSEFFVFFPKKSKKKKIIFWVSKFLSSKSTQILINVIFYFLFCFLFFLFS